MCALRADCAQGLEKAVSALKTGLVVRYRDVAAPVVTEVLPAGS